LSTLTNITANGTYDIQPTGQDIQVAVIVHADATFGSGTLTFLTRSVDESGDGETLDTNPSTIAAGHQQRFLIGKNMLLQAKLAGATSPDINITHTTL
jgi:hypothetical protein